jgi:glutathione peroxidase
MKHLAGVMLWILAAGAMNGAPAARAERDAKVKTVHDFVVKDIEDRTVPLSEYKGKVLLIVNVASRCGFTPQYAGLEKLYERYKEAGLVVLGFPANNFKNQEPGSDAEILQFCTTQYRITFPLFSKISVEGADQHPLYKFLTSEETNPGFAGPISWNFNKFLAGRDGVVVARFGSRDAPESSEVMQAVEKALGQSPSP